MLAVKLKPGLNKASFRLRAEQEICAPARGKPLRPAPKLVPSPQPQTVRHSLKNRCLLSMLMLTRQAYSLRLWLGFGAGLALRMTMGVAVAARFGAGLPSVWAMVILCMGAGTAAGILAYLTYRLGRRFNLVQPHKKEGGWSRELLRYAAAGLTGALLGAGIVAIGSAIARLGILAAGATALAALGLSYASATEPETRRDRRPASGWVLRALQGVGFGLAGCVIGLMCADLLRPHSAIAAFAAQDTNAVLAYVDPAPAPQVSAGVLVEQDPVVYAQALAVAKNALGERR